MLIFLQVIVILIAFGVSVFLTIGKKATVGRDEIPVTFRPVGLLFGALFLFIAIAFTVAIGQVDPGNRGVVVRLGAVTDRTLGEGFYFVTPFVDSVVMMSVQTELYETPAGAASKDLQDVNTSVAMNYHLNPSSVNKVYQTLRKDYVQRIVAPAIQESVKAVTARFDAEELITQRPTVKLQLQDELRERLAASGVLMDTVSLTNFEFSETFTASIEAKQVAAQDALRAENLLRQIEVEARQAKARAEGERDAAIARAEGEKQSAILRAEGEANAILKVAEAQAEGNELLNATITDAVTRYTLVKELSPDIRVVVLPSGQDFILGPEVINPVK